MTLLEPYNLPFAAALLLMLLLAIAQAIGLGDAFGDADADFDMDADGDAALTSSWLDGLFSLVGLGRVPFMAWLAVYLFIFAAAGIGIQALADSLLGAPFERWLAALITAGLAAPVTGVLVRPIGAILPKDRTTAVSLDTLLGRVATITDGVSRPKSPARARVIDQYGHPHHVMVEPDRADIEYAAGQEVLLVAHDGPNFTASPLAPARLADS